MLGWAVEVILDGGPSNGSAASTIVDCTGIRPRILREGAISAAELEPCSRTRDVAGDRPASQTPIPIPSPSRTPSQDPTRTPGPDPTVREYLLVFLVAGVVSYLLCVFARELAIRSGAVARVRDRDVHAAPIPYFGGVAMLGGLGAGLLVARHLPFLSTSPAARLPRRRHRADRRRDDLRGRRGRRPDRARRPDQARRPDRGGRLPGAQRRPALVAEPPRRRAVRPRPDPGACCSRCCWWSAP